ncbi:MAG TPA: glycosyltransferase family 2 protein [Candidatus Limnocylindrales bacterium]|nr:glycosyltransferase family 2 protein [Candidatus Limnocylindrales bacterium]
MTYPKISVVTPSFNQGPYIEQTILSIIRQDYPHLEYFIIDGGSKDNTLSILKKYEHKITYWISEPDRGQSHAINKGLKRATGDIVTWINSDDLVTEGTFFRVADLFQKESDQIGLIHGGTILFDQKGDIREDFGYENPTLERYLSGMSFSQPSAYIRRKYLDKVGLLNETYHYGMDYDLFARLALVTKFKKVKDVFSKYRLHAGSKSVALDRYFIEDWIRIFINIVGNLKLDWIRGELQKLKVFDTYFSDPVKFNFDFHQKVIDPRLMLFYFLSYVFKADYRTGNFPRARKVAAYLKKNYKSYMEEDKELKKVIQRLTFFPDFFIESVRRSKIR